MKEYHFRLIDVKAQAATILTQLDSDVPLTQSTLERTTNELNIVNNTYQANRQGRYYIGL